jgi:hypothetical protein
LFKYIESQYLSSLASDILREVICGPHVVKFGEPCPRQKLRLTFIKHYFHWIKKKKKKVSRCRHVCSSVCFIFERIQWLSSIFSIGVSALYLSNEANVCLYPSNIKITLYEVQARIYHFFKMVLFIRNV